MEEEIVKHDNQKSEFTGDKERAFQDEKENTESFASSPLKTYWLVVAIYLGRICQGLFLPILSPTLLFLADNVNRSVAEISPMFTGMSLGYLVGSMLAGFVLKFKNPMLYFGLCVLSCGLLLCTIPFLKSVVLLILVVTLSGVPTGLYDAGVQGLILRVWGPTNSRMHIQAFHFVFTVGAFLSPIIAKPFLERSSVNSSKKTLCPHTNVTYNEASHENNDTQSISARNVTEHINSFNPVAYTYIILSVFIVVCSFIVLILTFQNVTEKIQNKRRGKNYEVETRKEEPLKDVAIIFILFTFFLFALAGADHPMFNYIFSVAVCSKLNFTESVATLLTSIFWCGYGAGRLVAVPVSRHLKPFSIITICLNGCLLSLIILSIYGEINGAVTWATTFSFAFFSSPLSPAAISWMSSFFNISGKYIFIINFGNAIGSMVMVPINGIVFDQNPFSVIYVVLGAITFAYLVYVAMVIYARWQHNQMKLFLTDDMAEEKSTSNSLKSSDSN